MNDDLKPLFDHLRESERPAASAWHPRFLRVPAAEPRWAPRIAFAAVLACGAAFWLLPQQKPRLADFPPLLDSEPRELFASLDAPSTDFLLPTHLTIQLP
ncbi:MAG: hypothetical protein IPK22_07940 [Verrucomicrobiaceae bacterium]|nr:hypothetical protein [Verrucomicrobiaceae bacterium]